MIVDQSLLLGQFAKRRNAPVKYDRNLVQATIKAMERIEEIRAKRERVFTKNRLSGKAAREQKRREDLKVVAEGEHLIRKELQDLEAARLEGKEVVLEQEQELTQVLGEERLRMKSKRRMVRGGGTEEEMDLD
jgi:large subunit ribosomal protein L24e